MLLEKLKELFGFKKESKPVETTTSVESTTKPEVKKEEVKVEEKTKEPVRQEVQEQLKKESQEEIKENAEFEEMFGVSLDVKGVGDVVTVSVVSVEPTHYNAEIADNAQSVIIEKDKVNDPLFIGEEAEVKIYRRYDDDLYARPVVKKEEVKATDYSVNHFGDVISSLSVGDVITGQVVDYKEPFFRINYKGALINILEYRIDCPPILSPNDYVGNTYDFKVIDIKENKKNGSMYVEISRKEMALLQRLEDIKQFSIGDKLTITDYNANDGGIESRYKNVRVFIPYSKLTDGGFVNKNNVADFINLPLELEVVNIMDDSLICYVPGIESQVNTDFYETDHSGEKVSGKIVKIFDYGLLIKLNSGHKGLLHYRELDADQIKDVKSKELFDEIDVEIISTNKEKQQINFTLV